MTDLPSIACLQAFESVARHGSITRASQDLNLTQSAVSRQIRQLEDLLDVTLFERVRQRVLLTDAGKLFLNDVDRIMSSLRDATSRMMACGGNNGLLNLAVLPTFATRWLMPRLSDFLQKHPGVTVNQATRMSPFDFSKEPFDAAIHYGQPNWPGATAYHLMNEETAPVCSPHLLSTLRIRKPSDLSHAVLLHQTTRAEAWSEWLQMTEAKGIHPLRGPRFEQFTMLAQAAVCSLGVALLPTLLIEEELATGKLVVLFDRRIPCANAYYLVIPETKPPSLVTSAFTQWIVEKGHRGDNAQIHSHAKIS